MATYADLKDKIVVVTGGADGIGRSTALLFSRQQARVFVADINAEKGHELVEQISKEGGYCRFVRTDVTSIEQIAALAKLVKEAGTLSVLVNCAGGFPGFTNTSTIELPPDEWDRGVRLNLYSVFYCCQELVKLMDNSGGASIINITSNAARKAETHAPRYYSVSKAAVQQLTRILALELAPAIRVNAVAPGPTLSPRVKQATDERLEALRKKIPRGKLADPDEIASAILFLASEAAANITGATLDVNGGQVML